MRTLNVNGKALLSILCVVVTVAAAALVWHRLPTTLDIYGPFEVRGRAGEPVQGSALIATVTAVRIGPRLDSVPAAGMWVVIDTTLEAVRATELPRADLIVGPNTYARSDQFSLDTLGEEISPGIAQRGSWLFEVDPPLVEAGSSSPLLLRVWAGSDYLGSRLVIDIPADDPLIIRADDVGLAERTESGQ
ncbi:hypothetical protein [Mycolicibacterium parafortuitum]|uniref:hypothetical protein n=1 Tax=Mycolicibacterium parafortuitum TaxID=39692 RepID=UPI0032C43C79